METRTWQTPGKILAAEGVCETTRGRAEPVALRAHEAPGPKDRDSGAKDENRGRSRLRNARGEAGRGRTFGPTEPDASEGLREHGGGQLGRLLKAPLQQSSGGRRQIAVGWEGGASQKAGPGSDHESWDSSVHEKTVV